jgi:hypothetical protein
MEIVNILILKTRQLIYTITITIIKKYHLLIKINKNMTNNYLKE